MSLQQLADHIELQQLVTAYANAIDCREFERLDAVFTADAHIDYRAMGGIAGSYAEIRTWLPQALGAFPGYMHMVGNCEFDIGDEQASGRVACFNPMICRPPDHGADEVMFLGLWYLDRYVRTPDGWRIAERSEQRCYEFNMPQWLRAAVGL